MDKRTCPECHGDGVVHIEDQYIAVFCSHCKGKGYMGEEVVDKTISFSSSEAGRSQSERSSLARDCRKIAPELEGGVLIQTLCDALEERGREVERLREQARLREIDYWNLAREREEGD